MERSARDLLNEYGVRNTHCRRTVLQLFLDTQHTLSHKEIEKRVAEQYNRVTVYRTLEAFHNIGIIHKVLNDKLEAHYALCIPKCSGQFHQHDHMHFKCTVCGKTVCLPSKMPQINLPEGYLVKDVQMLAIGTCKYCTKGLKSPQST